MRARAVIVVISAAVLIVGLGLGAFWRAITKGIDLPIARDPSCVAVAGAGQPTGSAGAQAASTSAESLDDVVLDPERMANAATIAAVGMRRGVPQRAIVVALATASQESKLDNLGGGHLDSVGLFQQRPSQGWGTEEQLSDPRYASNAFYSKLLKVRGWQSMRVTDAAQAVQNSAYPEAYERWAGRAEVLARAFAGDSSGAVRCTLPKGAGPAGTAATDGLAEGLRQDWGVADAAPAVSSTGSKSASASTLAVPAADARTGWRYAHWVVAHAESSGVTRVRYANLQWTASSGDWKQVKDKDKDRANAATQVLAEVNHG